MKTLVVCSGGLDSVTLAHRIASQDGLERLLSFNYGQRHLVELHGAVLCGKRLGVRHDTIDISGVGKLIKGSALTDFAGPQGVDVPEGHYESQSMAATVVPNRNAIMLSIAFGVASATGCSAVATAIHGGDHFIYADCRPGFANAFAHMQEHSLEGMNSPQLLTPYIASSKADIATDAARYEVPIEQTWSCYKGGDIHCGRCGTCVERIEALHQAGVADPTEYEDSEFWKTAEREG